MSFKSEVLRDYVDVNNLVCNRKCLHTDVNPSGNGICYSGEYISILSRLGELNYSDIEVWRESMHRSMVYPGVLARGPNQPDIESVDDYYGLAAACAATGSHDIGASVLRWGKNSYGCFNNLDPWVWTWKSFLWRQPQLLCAQLVAANVLPHWYDPRTWWQYPLRGYTAAVIATSCMSAPKEDFDARRLCWLLKETVSPVSWLCRRAAKVWEKRLLKHYPEGGMKSVSALGFELGHPFNRYYPNT